MVKHQLVQNVKTVFRRYLRVMAFAVVGMVIGGACVSATLSVLALQNIPETVSVEKSKALFARSAPVRLIVPKANIDVTFEEPLGLNDDKTVEVPDSYEKVGWYKYGVTPGEIGSAVILGHVDSFRGPAVFFNLQYLHEGDQIQVEREDGTTALFEIDRLERYAQDNFPATLVYGKTNDAQLRLVTCTGTFDHGMQKYSHNLVVYASLVEPLTP